MGTDQQSKYSDKFDIKCEWRPSQSYCSAAAEWVEQLVEELWLELLVFEFFIRLVAELLRVVAAMKTIIKIAVLLMVLLAMGGGWALYNMFFNVILESKDVLNLKVEETPYSHPTQLKLSGLAFNSSMGIRKITTKRDGPAIVVLVHLSLASRGASGNFAYELTVPDSVKEVRFGRSNISIWKRGMSSTSAPDPPKHLE